MENPKIQMYYSTNNLKKWLNFKLAVDKYAHNCIKNKIKFERMIKTSDKNIKCSEENNAKTILLDHIRKLNVPTIVEHSILTIEDKVLKDIYDLFTLDKICEIFKDKDAIIKKEIVYTFGVQLVSICLIIEGKISDKPNGEDWFGWNPIFKPREIYVHIKINDEEIDTKNIVDLNKYISPLDSNRTIEQQDEMEATNKLEDALYKIFFDRILMDINNLVLNDLEKKYNNNYDNIQDLAKKIESKQIILFVGAGVSRLLGLVSWSDLVKAMGKDLGFDGDLFLNYENLLVLSEYYCNHKNLNQIVKEEFIEKTYDAKERLKNSKIYSYLYNLDFPIIYTTNYDDFIEKYYNFKNENGFKKEYFTITEIKDCVNYDSKKTAIIKFHGDFNSLNDIVLSESSYYSRIDLTSPLDTLFKADMLKKSVLFIGYGLADINVRNLINKLQELWANKGNGLRNISYFYDTNNNSVHAEVLSKKGIQPISTTLPPYMITSEDILQDYIINTPNIEWIDEYINHWNKKHAYDKITYSILVENIEKIIIEELKINEENVDFDKTKIKDDIKNIYRENNDFKNFKDYYNSFISYKNELEEFAKKVCKNNLILEETNYESYKHLNSILINLEDFKIEKVEKCIDYLSKLILENFLFYDLNGNDKHSEVSKDKVIEFTKKHLYFNVNIDSFYRIAMEKFLKELQNNENQRKYKIAIKFMLYRKTKNDGKEIDIEKDLKFLIFKRIHNFTSPNTWDLYGGCQNEITSISNTIEYFCNQLEASASEGGDGIINIIKDSDQISNKVICVSSFEEYSSKVVMFTYLIEFEFEEGKGINELKVYIRNKSGYKYNDVIEDNYNEITNKLDYRVQKELNIYKTKDHIKNLLKGIKCETKKDKMSKKKQT